MVNKVMNVKLILSTEELRTWYDHPITKLVMQALNDGNVKENSKFIDTASLSAEPYAIERTIYRLNGKSGIVRNIVDFDRLKDIVLRDYVSWEGVSK